MRVAIFGAGSIGCYLGGMLQAAGHDVVLIGRDRVRQEVGANGLTIVETGATRVAFPAHAVHFETVPEALAGASVVVLAMKLHGLAEAADAIARHAAPDALIVPMQNGVDIAERLRSLLPDHDIVHGIVGFNVAHLGPGRWEKASSGRIFAGRHPALATLGFTLVDDMRPIEWGKLILNLFNAVNALSGLPLKRTLADRGYRRVLAASISETMAATRAAGIVPAKVGAVGPRLIERALPLPDWLFNRYLLPVFRLTGNARLSMSADYDAGRPTEIDDLNGAVVALAGRHGLPAPVNEALVRLVKTGQPRHWTSAELLREVGLA